MIDLWHLRHLLQLRQLRTWIHDNLCYLTIKSDTGQHSQFLQCFKLQVLIHVLKDLPSGMFAGAKIPSKVRARTLIEMSFSLRTIDLDFTTGTFSTSGWMTLEWDDPRYWLQHWTGLWRTVLMKGLSFKTNETPWDPSSGLSVWRCLIPWAMPNGHPYFLLLCLVFLPRYRWEPAEYDNIVSVPLPFSKVCHQ